MVSSFRSVGNGPTTANQRLKAATGPLNGWHCPVVGIDVELALHGRSYLSFSRRRLEPTRTVMSQGADRVGTMTTFRLGTTETPKWLLRVSATAAPVDRAVFE